MKNAVLTSFYNSIKRLVRPGGTIIAAVSGGADSVALFHMLNMAREELKIKVVAAHYNHHLRGVESMRDELFVKKLAGLYMAPFETSGSDVKKASVPGRGGLEKTARDLRYSFLENTALKYHSKTIALGHNLDDNAETFIFRLITGAGAAGLSAIPEQRELSGGIRIIRPLLGIKKGDIESFLKEEKLPFVFDSSNAGNHYTRNRIRHSLVPLIEKEYNPGFKEAAARTAHIFARENEFMYDCAEIAARKCVLFSGGGARIDIKKFLRLHGAIRSRVASVVLSRLLPGKRKITFEKISMIERCAESPFSAELCGGFIMRPSGNFIKISPAAAVVNGNESATFDPCVDGAVEFNGELYSHSVVKDSGIINFTEKKCAHFDMRKISGSITVRHKKDGDRFTPYGMAGAIKLKKFFIDNKLEKNNPVFADAEKIIWVAKQRPSEDTKITGHTKRVLKIEFTAKF
jgi:tRNA(Ile)-lysidine synthase